MIELFIKLIEKGVELLREGERQKKLVFDDVVKPIQALFQKMYDDHLKTFAEIRSMLLSEESKSRDIVSFLKGRFLFERGTAEVLSVLTGTGDIRMTYGRIRHSLSEDFDEYISIIAMCLSSHSPDNDASVVYYAALSDVIDTLSEKNLSYQTREEALRDLEDIVRRFQSYYAEVMAKYLELQRLCSA